MLARADADRLMIGLNRQAIEFARDAVEEYGTDPNYFDPVGKVNGSASVAGDAHNASYARHLSSLVSTLRCWMRKRCMS